MRSIRPPSISDLTFIAAAPIFAIAGAVRLTQSDGDLAGHIRMGEAITAMRRIPTHSLASYTVPNDPLIDPAWLSEIFFSTLFRAGGLALIAVVTGLVIGLTHAAIAQFLRRRGIDARVALITAMASLLLASSHWLARPHMFSIVGATLTLFLLESKKLRGRVFYFPALFALWANLHGGWLFGLLLIAAYLVGDLGEAWISPAVRAGCLLRVRKNLAALSLSIAATLLNPYGVSLYREVFGAVTSVSLADNIDEYMSPNFHKLGNFPFLAALLLVLVIFGTMRKRVPLPWLLTILMTVFFSLRSGRNIALFAVTAVPLLALYACESWPLTRRAFPYFATIDRLDSHSRPGLWSIPVAILLLSLGLNRGHAGNIGIINDQFDSRIFPVEAVNAARTAGLQGRVFHPWTWGGYFLEAWPESSIHVDPLKFSQLTMDSHTRIEGTYPGWQAELARWRVEVAVIEPRSRLALSLAADPAWTTWYRDSTAVIFRHAPYPATTVKERP